MAILIFLGILIILSYYVFHYKHQNLRSITTIFWPPLVTIPKVLKNFHPLHDLLADYINRSGGTIRFRGPWFSNMDMLYITDPLDVRHVLSKNFLNYPKGKTFHKIFDLLGDGIFNADGDLWELQRKTILSLFRKPSFKNDFEAIVWSKVEKGLLPIIESISKLSKDMDLQDIFQRFTFDTICKLLLDYDPQTLSLDFPSVPCQKSFTDLEEGLAYRMFTPPIFWKLQQLLRTGNEKKLSEACNTIDDFIYKCIDRIQNDSGNLETEQGMENLGLAKSMLREFKSQSCYSGNPNKLLKDAIVNLIGAGKDTTSTTLSWFFYLVARNPIVEDKIREEIHTFFEVKEGYQMLKSLDLEKLVYLHGALCETLRLYTPLPTNYKSALQSETLPSGHRVRPNTQVMLYYYGMGRMKNIWGKDYKEFKPERWILKDGKIKHEPSHKFPAFYGGPRTCLGKDMSLNQLKIVASTIIYYYHIELVEGHPVSPSISMVLQMKYGLKVRLTKITK